LDAGTFIRVHRSALVRRSEIAALRRRTSGAIALALVDGTEIPVGRRYAAEVRTLLAKHPG
jgi:DNA-binding LytR/AlgR family response regulator